MLAGMVVCPVCEHAQASGDDCEVCGKRLAPAGSGGAEVPPLEDLEPTLRDGVGTLRVERMEGIEPTARDFEDSLDVPIDSEPWIERAMHDPVEPEPGDPVDVEPTPHAGTGGEPAGEFDPFAPPTCRYCRTLGAPGELFCERCGMKLDIYRPGPGTDGP